MKGISRRLTQAILDSNCSYAELERKTGIPKSSIQRYATGTTKKIPIDAVKLIADATNYSAAWIMGWGNDSVEKKNDAITDIILKLRSDAELLELVTEITLLLPEQRIAVQSLLSAFNNNK
jgi:transcriptional regulator with XRE-family HTH domain